jgi:hypothetical protein
MDMIDFQDTVPVYNNGINLYNELYQFIEENDMKDDCILDAIMEFSIKNNYNPIEVAEVLSEYKGFQNNAQINLMKHKHIKQESDHNKPDNVEEWC